ncbi:MAG: branched-chain amino acid ABC transporter permease [Gammaproteobacteria bacterium]|nr:branched-chain amino acid ABC transporter permease [Gammaproteobacteria bacterium]
MTDLSFSIIRHASYHKLLSIVGGVLLLFIMAMPWWGDSNWMREFVQFSCYLVFALAWNLLAGYGGMVSIGQQAFLGFGGYTILILGNFFSVNPFLAIPLAGLSAGLLAFFLAKVTLRLQGGYFAIGTWVVAELVRLSFANITILGGGSGTSLTALREVDKYTREAWTFWSALMVVVTVILWVFFFLRSKQGLALLAIKDNATAAQTQGIEVDAMKTLVYVIAGIFAGLVGAVYFIGNIRISPDAAFSVNWTAFAIVMVVIGGIGTIEGPILGALIFWVLTKWFSDYGSWYLIGLGTLTIVFTMVFKKGVWGYLSAKKQWSIFPIYRKFKVSSFKV